LRLATTKTASRQGEQEVPDSLLHRAARSVLVPVSTGVDRLGNRFYVLLAALLALAAFAAITTGLTAGMQNKAYDLLVKWRVRAPAPDPAIVIVDIDEASLATLAGEYGRWPWPRQVMGELVEGIAAQKPAAIVFDIAFSDRDVFNVESDRYFGEVVARHANSYFPIIRLDPAADAGSELRLAEIPGVTRGAEAQAEARLAAVVPYFFGIVKGPRLGTTNLVTDGDGILRAYRVHGTEYGWRLRSLAATVVAGLGGDLPAAPDVLLNWRGRQASYARVSFHEIYGDLLRRAKERPSDEFAGKIVVIGSTAASLFDYKATPVARVHAGVDILATAIDNLRHGDYLREMPGTLSIAITLVALVLLAVAFVYQVDARIVNVTFTAAQGSFLAVSYLFLNFSTLYVDLTAPFAFSLGYFTVARAGSQLRSYRRSGHPLFSDALEPGRSCCVILVQADLHVPAAKNRLRLIGDLKREIGRSRLGVATPASFKETPLLRAFFRDRLLFYWLVPEAQAGEAFRDVLASLERSLGAGTRARNSYLRRGGTRLGLRLHAALLAIDSQDEWRRAGEQALAQLYVLPGGEAAVEIVASDEFRRLCVAQALAIPPALAEAGLRCEERRHKPRKKVDAT
jgi:CHASE2 domain-containing sensor protein